MTTVKEAREVYSEALSRYREAQELVQGLIEQISGLSEALAKPLTLAPKHATASETIPLHVMTSPFRREVDLESWPDGGTIVEALSALHAAHARVQSMYAWLLPTDRDTVEAP